jgi:hypothetical protein
MFVMMIRIEKSYFLKVFLPYFIILCLIGYELSYII